MKSVVLGFMIGMIVMTVFIGTLDICLDAKTTTHFYVKSATEGYKTCIDIGSRTLCIGKPFHNPTDANILTEELNRDMEGNWGK